MILSIFQKLSCVSFMSSVFAMNTILLEEMAWKDFLLDYDFF
jgi:hypothetical protein